MRDLQELGGWKSFEMVLRYSHLSPGHLAQHAERTLLGPAPEKTEEPAAKKENAA